MKLVTATQLAKESGADRGRIPPWLDGAGIKPVIRKGQKLWPREESLEVISVHARKSKSLDANIDPDTGLTWFQKKTMEESRKLKRLNDEAEELVRGTYVLAEKHHEILRAVVDRIEQLPDKLRSEAALSDAQVMQLRRALDEVRAEAAKEIGG